MPTVSLSICSLGVNGTVYTRENQPATSVEIPAGEIYILQVEHIQALYPHANVQVISLRQSPGTELSFVSFENQTSATNVIIDTTSLSDGEYALVLETFDADSDGVESTLKIDTVTIVVISQATVTEIGCPLPTFTEPLLTRTILSGEKYE